MSNNNCALLSFDEQVAASTMASLSHSAASRKRDSDFGPDGDDDAIMACSKRVKLQNDERSMGSNATMKSHHSHVDAMSITTESAADATASAANANPNNSKLFKKKAPGTAPFFHYTDYSAQPDPDPLTPLTAPGRVPNFPAKMHSILSRPDLRDVVCWMPHGRSWRVLKPREFEIRVLPTYFEHAKFSSFIRQANGWGFRRMTKGRDRNSYYHELFLRGLPHLAKHMKRPGVAQKKLEEPTQEPDLAAVSSIHPVPETIPKDDETNVMLLECTLQGGPRARMPIYTGAASILGAALPNVAPTPMPQARMLDTIPKPRALQEVQQEHAKQQQAALLQQLNDLKPAVARPVAVPGLPPPASLPSLSAAALPHRLAAVGWNHHHRTEPSLAAAAASLRAASVAPAPWAATLAALQQQSAQEQARAAARSAAASQFAAGFAAATAYSQQQFRNLLGGLAAAQQDQHR